ncbi:MAG: alpha/beta hydrolase [Nocardioides sp.]
MPTPLPADVVAWRDAGESCQLLGRTVFVRDMPSRSGVSGAPLVLVHGFPGSSFDWAGVVARLAGTRRLLMLDLPGYGLSAKPKDGDYSLFRQADVVEALLAARGIDRCVLVAHDMGDTVTAELLARRNAGLPGPDFEQVVLTNGSIFIDQAQLTRGQRLTLRLPARALPLALPTAVLRRSLLESFAPQAPPPAGAIDALVALVQHDRGGRILPVLIRYIEERRLHQERWTSGLVDHPAPLTLLWGELDPIAVVGMAHHLKSLRPDTLVRTFAELGHWPSIESPDVIADEISRLG